MTKSQEKSVLFQVLTDYINNREIQENESLLVEKVMDHVSAIATAEIEYQEAVEFIMSYSRLFDKIDSFITNDFSRESTIKFMGTQLEEIFRGPFKFYIGMILPNGNKLLAVACHKLDENKIFLLEMAEDKHQFVTHQIDPISGETYYGDYFPCNSKNFYSELQKAVNNFNQRCGVTNG